MSRTNAQYLPDHIAHAVENGCRTIAEFVRHNCFVAQGMIDDNCPICTEALVPPPVSDTTGRAKRISNRLCSHIIHLGCLSDGLEADALSTCPVCRHRWFYTNAEKEEVDFVREALAMLSSQRHSQLFKLDRRFAPLRIEIDSDSLQRCVEIVAYHTRDNRDFDATRDARIVVAALQEAITAFRGRSNLIRSLHKQLRKASSRLLNEIRGEFAGVTTEMFTFLKLLSRRSLVLYAYGSGVVRLS